jgi:hypothetical protein
MIDAELLEKIVNEVAVRRLAQEFHELIVYSGNKEICEIYKRYMDEVNNENS